MENKEIVEGNKLIAEFISIKKDLILHCGKDVNYYLIVVVPPNGDDGNWHNEYFLNFHCSWDWLMPVVEKIGQLVLDGGQYGKHVDFQISTNDGTGWIFWMKNIPGDLNQPQAYLNIGTLIEKTYYAVVEFIKWYNNGK